MVSEPFMRISTVIPAGAAGVPALPPAPASSFLPQPPARRPAARISVAPWRAPGRMDGCLVMVLVGGLVLIFVAQDGLHEVLGMLLQKGVRLFVRGPHLLGAAGDGRGV